MKNNKNTKEKGENSRPKMSKNKITNKQLTNLDNFIQQCLDKFKFIDPKQEFYDATGDEKDLIISHKSTIPDLVIWNKKFNKVECFEEGNTKKVSLFPRFQFYLRIKSNKPDKDKKREKKSEKVKDKNNQNKKSKENKEGKKNKKKQENKNNINNITNDINSISINNIISNNNNTKISNNSNNENNYNSKSEKKILDLSELDINKIKEFNPRHKNNFFSSNKEIMDLNDYNPALNDNKFNNGGKIRNLKEFGINGDIIAKEKKKVHIYQKDYSPLQNKIGKNLFNQNFNYNEFQGINDVNITINNNNYIQQYQINNNNINRLININNKNEIYKDCKSFNFPLENSFLDNKINENQLINVININSKNQG